LITARLNALVRTRSVLDGTDSPGSIHVQQGVRRSRLHTISAATSPLTLSHLTG